MSLVSNKPITWVAFLGEKKSALNCFAHSLLASNHHKLRRWGLLDPRAWSLSSPRSCSRTGMAACIACWHSGSYCTWLGDYQPRAAVGRRALQTSVISGGLYRWMESCFPFPGLCLDDVLPMGQMMMRCFQSGWREPTGTMGFQVLVEALRWWQIVSVLQAAEWKVQQLDLGCDPCRFHPSSVV